MKKARISELKDRLSHYLRYVRQGQSVLVYDRDRPIARIDPLGDSRAGDGEDWTAELVHAGVLRPPAGALAADWLERRLAARCDVVGALLDERESSR